MGLVLAGSGLAQCGLSAERTTNSASMIVVVGMEGEVEYGEQFRRWASRWREAGAEGGAVVELVGMDAGGGETEEDRLKSLLQHETKETPNELWLVLIGHGTFDGRDAKFNLRGPDFSASDLALWLQPFRRPLIVVNTAPASAPFIKALSGPGRVIVTATRSGFEQNHTRFGDYLSQAITGDKADLDKDHQVSLLEAFLGAARSVSEWYELEGRLATEHPLLDDNGDGRGTPADWFRGIRAVSKDKEGVGVDGFRAHQVHLRRSAAERAWPVKQRARRDELELQVAKLREGKAGFSEQEYYRRLEESLLEMARLYESADGEEP